MKLKDGLPSVGKRVLIDGQQRMTALMAALLGQQVVTKDYEKVRIRIAFHSPLSNGALLADAVGPGKTIEAGLVISQKWAERQRRIPSSGVSPGISN